MRLPGFALIIAAAMLWGSTGTAQELGAPGASPLGVGAMRLVVGACALVVIAKATGGLRVEGKIPIAPTVAMAVGIAAYQLSFFAAVRQTGVALGTVVAIGSGPLLTGLITWTLTGVRPGRRWLIATVIAIAGVLLISRPDAAEGRGVVLALVAGASYAVYAVAAERLVHVMSPQGAMAVGFTGGALLLLPVLPATDLSWVTTVPGAAAVMWLGVAATALAYVFFGWGLRSTPVAAAASLSLAEPVTAFFLGFSLLGERPAPAGWVGAALVLAALVGLSRQDAMRSVEKDRPAT